MLIEPDMTFLDIDETAFTSMLMHLSPFYRKTLPAGRLRKGDFINEGNKQWVVLEIKPKHFNDWFSDEMIAVVGRPWLDQQSRVKIEWLEDRLLPRRSYG